MLWEYVKHFESQFTDNILETFNRSDGGRKWEDKCRNLYTWSLKILDICQDFNCITEEQNISKNSLLFMFTDDIQAICN